MLFVAASFLFACLFCFPWLIRDFVGLEHDTLFHLSRIDALSNALFHGDLVPRIYPYENNGYGNASPMFYCDFFLAPAAILCHFGLPLSSSYVLTVLLFTWLGNYFMLSLCHRVSKNILCSVLVTAAFCFANYHITDVFVRSALGEFMAISFLPVILEGLYVLFIEKDTSGWIPLWIGLTGLIMTHNLTFLLMSAVIAVFFMIYFIKAPFPVLLSFLSAVFLSFLCTSWYTIPMIEQLFSQKFVLSSWTENDIILGLFAVSPQQYFMNSTVFGYGSNNIPLNEQMRLNIGFFLALTPLLYFFVKKKNSFVTACMILGYICLILPISLVPWNSLTFLRIIQFPWRLFALAMPLLAVPSVYSFANLVPTKKGFLTAALILVCAESIYHLVPVLSRDYGITSKNSYADLLSGEIVDPYYANAPFVRVQLASGEYLPEDHSDFRLLPPAIRDTDGNNTGIIYERDYNKITFTVTKKPADSWLVMPLTWYKGYSATMGIRETFTSSTDNKFVAVYCTSPGIYTVFYEGTVIQKFSLFTSLVGFLIVGETMIRKRIKK